MVHFFPSEVTILPRQARKKHRETQNKMPFLQTREGGSLLARACLPHLADGGSVGQ